MNDHLAIIVLTHNDYCLARRAMAALLQHTAPPFTVIQVDNGSIDGTENLADEMCDARLRKGVSLGTVGNLRAVRAPTNEGTGARNRGLELARELGAPLVANIDSDVTVGPGWDTSWRAVMDSDRACGIVGPCGVRLNQDWSQMGYGYGNSVYFGASVAYEGVTLDLIPGMAWMLRLSALAPCPLLPGTPNPCSGGYDETYNPGWAEDADVNLQVKFNGFKLRLARAPLFHYGGGKQSHKFVKDIQGVVHRNLLRLAAKWEPHKRKLFELARGAAAVPGDFSTPPLVPPAGSPPPTPQAEASHAGDILEKPEHRALRGVRENIQLPQTGRPGRVRDASGKTIR